jgi:hypothetical protein
MSPPSFELPAHGVSVGAFARVGCVIPDSDFRFH